MTQSPHTPPPYYERAEFHTALSGLQGKMDRSTTLEQALALMPSYGLSWQVTAGDGGMDLRLAHDDGHYQDTYADSLADVPGALGWLIGLPALLLGPAEPGEPEPEPQAAALQVASEPEPQPAARVTAAAESLAQATDGTIIQVVPAPEAEPEAAADPSHSTEPLSDADKATCVAMVKAMDAETRKAFTIAFRDAFHVPRDARAVAPLIQEARHLAFVQRFVDEAEGVAAA
jgi:hypothetical protein